MPVRQLGSSIITFPWDPSRSTKETKKAETSLAELRGRAEAEKEALQAAVEERVREGQATAAKLEHELQTYKVGTSCSSVRPFHRRV